MQGKVADFLTDAAGVPWVTGEETVAAALAKVHGTHEIVLVYEEGKFAGMVWPYRLVFEARPAGNTRVRSVAVMPPRLTGESGLEEAAGHMLSTRAYTLPVFKDGEVAGVVEAREVLKKLLESGEGWEEVRIRKPLTAGINDPVKKVWTRLRREKRSRVVVVDAEGKLVGVVSRRDIYRTMISPPTGRQRYSNRGGGEKSMVFDEDWVTKLDYPIGELVRRRTVWLPEKSGIREALRELLDEGVGSTVLVDGAKRPAGVVSVRSFLKTVADAEEETKVAVEVTDRNKILDAWRRQEIVNLLKKWAEKMGRREELARLEVVVTGLKNAVGKARRYEGTAEAVLGSGRALVARVGGADLRAMVHEAMDKLGRQLGREKGD